MQDQIDNRYIYNKSFKHGDIVEFQGTPGKIICIYKNLQALFLADEPKDNFFTWYQVASNPSHFQIFEYYIKSYFNISNIQNLEILNKKRFILVNLNHLVHQPRESITLNSLHRKRHLYVKMAQHFLRSTASDEKLNNIYNRIENVQISIDFLENKIKKLTL